jgi:hypothetical protein
MVEPPTLINCAEATKWRNTYCAPTTPETITPDVASCGVERDWLQFYWAVNTRGDAATERWLMEDLFTLYAGVMVPLSINDVRWGELVTEAQSSFPLSKVGYFETSGNDYGVSGELAP